MKEVIISDTTGFRLTMKKEKCSTNTDVFRVQFIRSIKNADQEIESDSTYEFFINQLELNLLAKELTT